MSHSLGDRGDGPGGNLRGSNPSCVYNQIARTAAWNLLLSMGYTVPEANQALGFTQTPQIATSVLTVTTHGKTGLVTRMTEQWAEDPDLRQWVLNSQKQLAKRMVLRGCFRGRDYGLPWQVICDVWEGSLEQKYLVATLEDLQSLTRLQPEAQGNAYPAYFRLVA